MVEALIALGLSKGEIRIINMDVPKNYQAIENLSEINYVNNSSGHAIRKVNFNNTEADTGGRINVYREGHAGLASDVHNTYQNLSSAYSYRSQ